MTTGTTSTWSWNEAPFSTKIDPRRFYAGVTQEEALSRLHFLVENRRRLGLVVAPRGCGKSMLLEVAARQLRQQGCQVVLMGLIGVDADEFLWQLAAGLGANPKNRATTRELWREVHDRVLANRYQRINTVLLLDDVDEAEVSILTSLSRLVDFDQTDDSRLTLILSSEVGRTDLMGDRLQDLVDLRVEVEPWSSEETREFIAATLAASGCSHDLFDESALDRLFEITRGIPRRIQQLAQLALIAAAAQDLAEIDAETLDAVERELSNRSAGH